VTAEAGVSAISFHPRPAAVHHKGEPDYALVRELRRRVDVPVIVSGGLASADRVRSAYEASGADGVMIARGALGDPWIFDLLTGRREGAADEGEILAELDWVLERGERHWGAERAARNLRKFYPWYLERLGISGEAAHAYQRAETLDEVRALLAGAVHTPLAA
jgi:tRNA-dihydrouridine synthase